MLMSNLPPERATLVYTVPVGICVAVIDAPGSVLPALFFTIPEILLVVTCACSRKGIAVSAIKKGKIFL